MRTTCWPAAALLAISACASSFAQDDPQASAGTDSSTQHPAGDGAPNEAEQARIAHLIAELGDRDYETRDEAQRRLAKLGPLAFDALATAEGSPNVEISRRATYLLRSIRIPWIRDDDPVDVRKLLRNYDALDDAKRLGRIDDFAVMPSDVATGPLCRIVRYEKRSALAKAAALLIVDRPPPEGETLARQRATIRRTLGASRRTAARWLLAYERFFAQPDEALAEWEKILDDETAALAKKSSEASASQIFRLRKRQHAMLVSRGRSDDANAAIGQMVLLVPAETQPLVEFIEWLASVESWEAIDDVAKRHAALFERNALLVYALADAQLKSGKRDEAEKTAARALNILPDALDAHSVVAKRLSGMGLFEWAEREYRFIIERSPKASSARVEAGLEMSAMFQDRERYLDAATARKEIVALIDETPSLREQLEATEFDYFSPRRIRAGMEYCYAMHHGAEGNRTKQLEHLEEAAGADPHDADVLIALYRLPDQDDERRATTKLRIERATRSCQRKIDGLEAESDELSGVVRLAIKQNEYAWLVSNTFGDYDRALDYAVKSNAVFDNAEAGLLDTLARCHFAKGDLDSAIRVQTRANQMEPHGGAIARQLAFFRDEAAKREAAKRGAASAGAAPRATEPD